MGGTTSKPDSYRQSSSSSWNQNDYFQSSSYPQSNQNYAPPAPEAYPYPAYLQEDPNDAPQVAYPYPAYNQQPNNPPPPPQVHSGHGNKPQRKFDRRYSRIADNYNSLEEVTEALARAGLESSNLIVGIDFTKSNEWTGSRSYNRRSLHHIGDDFNPYEQAISIIGKTLAAFDEDNLIPCYGFGDASTHDQDVFSFYPEDGRYCNGFEEVLSRYREIVPHLRLAGPTSFAPIIEMAMTIVEQSSGQYHVLVIIADGQVTRSVDTEGGQLSPQEQKTVDAIVKASNLPLSIVLVGVGDGPWDMMKEFDDNIPARVFDNFQFVNFTEIMSKKLSTSRKETEFALKALMEIPSQYKASIELKMLGSRRGNVPTRVPLPPPVSSASSFSSSKASHSTSSKPSVPSYDAYSSPPYDAYKSPVGNAPPASSSTFDHMVCPICLTNSKDMAFGCGHQTCRECGQDLQTCPICRSQIQTRIKLY
ncbi:RING-type E3 ubiquitin transferase [Heracleum sosnowskyi]|uniref:RING-type E3 ubiquitin transferase n=1 Tax=Heracleum sosnowskyi TaxID=360622 RepID=A0AAD8IF57_9APIA|nr:RING-type E3 ubiquitin transferase [Heracleum sosnowskyi]